MQKEKINKVQNNKEYKNIEIKKENKETSHKNEDNENIEDEKEDNKEIFILDNNLVQIANKCKSSEEIDILILNYCKQNKNILSKQKIFIRTFKHLYQKVKMKDHHLKYLYTKYKRLIFPETLDELFEYSKNVEDLGYFCRNISKCFLIDKKGNIIEHSHIIFFTEIMIKRLLTAENLLIDGTFTYPKNFYQTIIIMFYDPICFKMIPGIFIAINNKTLEGYTECFKYIKEYIYNYIKNDFDKIKWKIFTTDFEYSLFTAFKNVFDNLGSLVHKGCFFHYLKNIRKYLVKNGFTKKENQNHYKYLINNCYQLPLKKNIDKSIEKDIKKICNKDKKYIEFLEYFNNQWLEYFKNKTLNLNKINIKFRTTNSLENFNRILKNEFNQKGAIENTIYIDTLISIFKEQNEYFKKEIGNQPKLVNKKIKYGNNENKDLDYSLDKEIEIMLEEIDQNNEEGENIENKNSRSSKTNSSNEEDEKEEVNSNNLNNKKGFKWFNNSCSFDSFLSIFIYSIYPNIKDSLNNKNIIHKISKKFELFMKFIKDIIDNYLNKDIKFYDIYENFNRENNDDLFELLDNEKYEYVPTIINYRPLVNIDYFIIKYKIRHFCSGNCKFSNQPTEFLNSTPYIDIPLIAYEDNNAKNIEEIFNNYIYMDINTICQDEKCSDEKETIVNWYIKKYNILEMPIILSINTNINDYNKLISYKEFINKIFLQKITLYNNNYNLLGFITQPSFNHYIGYFENYYNKYSFSLNKWFKFNDFKGYYEELKNHQLSLENIRASESVVLFVYIKSN